MSTGIGKITPILFPEFEGDWKERLKKFTIWKEEEEKRKREELERRKQILEERRKAISNIEETENIEDIFAAIDTISMFEIVSPYITEDRGDGHPRFDPPYRPSKSGTSCFIINDHLFYDLRENQHGDVIQFVALETGIIDSLDEYPKGEKFWKVVDELRKRGYKIPKLKRKSRLQKPEIRPCQTPSTPSEIRPCQTPSTPSREPDIKAIRKELEELPLQAIEEPGYRLIVYTQGIGKTHSISKGIAENDIEAVVYTPTLQKAAELWETGFFDLFLRGRGAPVKIECIKGECDHWDPELQEWTCPRMCAKWDEVKKLVEAGWDVTHTYCIPRCELRDECEYMKQWGLAKQVKRIVTEHAYLGYGKRSLLDKTLHVCDENPLSQLITEMEITAEDLALFATVFTEISEDWLAEFCESIALEMLKGKKLDEAEVNTKKFPKYCLPPFSDELKIGNELAIIKRKAWEEVARRIRENEWNGEKNIIDAVLALLARSGVNRNACLMAISIPAEENVCPVCGHKLIPTDDVKLCPNCKWKEGEDIVILGTEKARVTIDVKDKGGEVVLVYRRFPNPSIFPDNLIGIEAHGSEALWRMMFGREFEVIGRKEYRLKGFVTQIVDGAYHLSTIKQSKAARRKIQNAVDRICSNYRRVLVIGRKDLRNIVTLPKNTDFIHFHSLAGLNKMDYDCCVVIGAPHPNIKELTSVVELLTGEKPKIEVEYLWRQLNYTDREGKGREMLTKTYKGWLGVLFQELRETEIEQAVHRVRPLLREVDIYLLTAVPTNLPIDMLVEAEAIANPLEYAFGVTEKKEKAVIKAMLGGLKYVREIAEYTGLSYWSVWRTIKKLIRKGIIEQGRYDCRRGFRHTLSRHVKMFFSFAEVLSGKVHSIVAKVDGVVKGLQLRLGSFIKGSVFHNNSPSNILRFVSKLVGG